MDGESKQEAEPKISAAANTPASIPSVAAQIPNVPEDKFLVFNIFNPRTWSPLHIFLFCLAYRAGTALICRTTFVPDEYYQSVEVAYKLVFKRGITTWEWEEEHAIRSHVYILPYMVLFQIGKVLGISHTWFYSTAPRVLTAIYVACTDLQFYLLALRIAWPDTRYANLAKRGSTGECVYECVYACVSVYVYACV